MNLLININYNDENGRVFIPWDAVEIHAALTTPVTRAA